MIKIKHSMDEAFDAIRYRPFAKRHRKKGVKTVRNSRGTFIATGVGGTGGSVTYEEFLAGKTPA